MSADPRSIPLADIQRMIIAAYQLPVFIQNSDELSKRYSSTFADPDNVSKVMSNRTSVTNDFYDGVGAETTTTYLVPTKINDFDFGYSLAKECPPGIPDGIDPEVMFVYRQIKCIETRHRSIFGKPDKEVENSFEFVYFFQESPTQDFVDACIVEYQFREEYFKTENGMDTTIAIEKLDMKKTGIDSILNMTRNSPGLLPKLIDAFGPLAAYKSIA